MNQTTQKNRIVVVGGGTAGAIAASYIKSYWTDNVEVVLIYDHKKPNIGIGESLTPKIYSYLNYIGVSREELIKNVNATVKLGIKFKKWLNEDNEFYHSFSTSELNEIDPRGFVSAYDIVTDRYDLDTCYGKDMFEFSRIPSEFKSAESLHIDGVLFSKYIIEKFKDRLTILDDTVESVVKKADREEIDYLILKSGKKISGNFYIDATGFSCSIFKELKNQWVDRSNELPLDSCIPNPIPHTHEKIPVYTTTEASDQGWVLQVPLSVRWGCGYLYSSQFCSDDLALNNFSNFVKSKFNTDLTNTKVLNFKSGYWKKQWIGNCLVVGLSAGFAEPLEATNIHHAVFQITQFVDTYNFNSTEFDSYHYNKMMELFYDRVYLFIRFCYTTKRTDSEFWKYMTNNTPYEVKILEEKIQKDFLNADSMQSSIFNYNNFIKIAVGLNKIDKNSYKNILNMRSMYNKHVDERSLMYKFIKKEIYDTSLDHTDFINRIKNSTL